MKNCISILLICAAFLFQPLAEALGQPVPFQLDHALNSGNADQVSGYFAPSVDITVNGASATYSKIQGEIILKDFFNKHRVRSYEAEMAGNSNSEPALFTIGRLRTGNGDFKIYIWLQPVGNSYNLKAIKFEKIN